MKQWYALYAFLYSYNGFDENHQTCSANKVSAMMATEKLEILTGLQD